MLFSNVAEGETVQFKYYDAENDITYSCVETLEFRKDMVVADAFETFTLNTNSALAESQFKDVDLSLEVYPNPFKDLIHIEYAVVERMKVRIAVYDIVGNEVEILEERFADPGLYYIDWNAAAYPESTYILKLTTEDSYMMKKLLLIK
jgi:hypothetical protein